MTKPLIATSKTRYTEKNKLDNTESPWTSTNLESPYTCVTKGETTEHLQSAQNFNNGRDRLLMFKQELNFVAEIISQSEFSEIACVIASLALPLRCVTLRILISFSVDLQK